MSKILFGFLTSNFLAPACVLDGTPSLQSALHLSPLLSLLLLPQTEFFDLIKKAYLKCFFGYVEQLIKTTFILNATQWMSEIRTSDKRKAPQSGWTK